MRQRGHTPADGFTYVSGLESQIHFQCTYCHQEMELKYWAQWLLLQYLLAEEGVAPSPFLFPNRGKGRKPNSPGLSSQWLLPFWHTKTQPCAGPRPSLVNTNVQVCLPCRADSAQRVTLGTLRLRFSHCRGVLYSCTKYQRVFSGPAAATGSLCRQNSLALCHFYLI